MSESKGDVKGLDSDELFVVDKGSPPLGAELQKYFNPKYMPKFMTEFQVGKQLLKFYGYPIIMGNKSKLIETHLDAMLESDPPFHLASEVDVVHPRSFMSIWMYMNIQDFSWVTTSFYTYKLTPTEIINMWSWINYFNIPISSRAVSSWFLSQIMTLRVSEIKDEDLKIVGSAAKRMIANDKVVNEMTTVAKNFRDNVGERRKLLGLDFFDIGGVVLKGDVYQSVYMERLDTPTPISGPVVGRAIYFNKPSNKFYFIDFDSAGPPKLLPETDWAVDDVQYFLEDRGPLVNLRLLSQQPRGYNNLQFLVSSGLKTSDLKTYLGKKLSIDSELIEISTSKGKASDDMLVRDLLGGSTYYKAYRYL